MRKGLFVGAGFSFDFAMPLVWELTEEMRKLLPIQNFINFNNKWNAEGNGFSDKAVLLFKGLYEDKSIHYEQIVGGLELYANRHENSEVRQDLCGIKTWFMEMIYYLLYPRQIGNQQYNSTTIKMYRGLLSLVNNGYPLWIFSLNHDLMIECFAGENDIPLRNGFLEKKLVKFKDNSDVDKRILFKYLEIEDMEKEGFNFFNKVTDRGINLLKIHGSLDTFGYNDLKSYLSIHVENPGLETISKALASINEVIIPDDFSKVNNEIVIRDENDEIQFLRRSLLSGVFKFSKKSSQVIPPHFLNSFQENINFCEELIVIGYGFGDLHINNIFKAWLEPDGKRLLRVVSPSLPCLNFLGCVGKQVVYESKTSLEYVSSLPGGELTAEENRVYKIRNEIRKNPDFEKKYKEMFQALFGQLKNLSDVELKDPSKNKK